MAKAKRGKPTRQKVRQKIYRTHNLKPRTQGQSRAYLEFIDMQGVRDMARAILLDAELALDEARRRANDPATFVEMHRVDAPRTNFGEEKILIHSIAEKIRLKVAAFKKLGIG